jgi:hypothetical protein
MGSHHQVDRYLFSMMSQDVVGNMTHVLTTFQSAFYISQELTSAAKGLPATEYNQVQSMAISINTSASYAILQLSPLVTSFNSTAISVQTRTGDISNTTSTVSKYLPSVSHGQLCNTSLRVV